MKTDESQRFLVNLLLWLLIFLGMILDRMGGCVRKTIQVRYVMPTDHLKCGLSWAWRPGDR